MKKAVVATVATLSACALAACSAGQITQTSHQVPAIDGAAGGDQATGIYVGDVTVLLDEHTGEAALKFIATNQDPNGTEYNLVSAEVNGQRAQLGPSSPIAQDCSLIGDSADHLAAMPTYDGGNCYQYVETVLNNDDFAFGGNVDVRFTFDNLADPIEVTATVAAPTLPAGDIDRDYTEGAGL